MTKSMARDGAREAAWLHSRLRETPMIEVDELGRGVSRVVVVAPHPDDDVLGTGGLLAELAANLVDILLIIVTDGEGSHRGSRRWTPESLRAERVRESSDALQALGIGAARIARLGVPDGHVAQGEHDLVSSLRTRLKSGDLVFTTWKLDGHPDHDACGRAVAQAALETGAMLCEIPIWMWSRREPDDAALPWASMVRVRLGEKARARKRDALRRFVTQRQRDPDVADTPILSDAMLEHFDRPFETVIRTPRLDSA